MAGSSRSSSSDILKLIILTLLLLSVSTAHFSDVPTSQLEPDVLCAIYRPG